MQLTIKNVKTFEGHDGHGYNCTLYVDGKRAAKVVDLANGGETDFHAINKTLLEQAEAWAKEQPPIPSDFGDWELDSDLSLIVGIMVDEFLADKQIKGWTKKNSKTVFIAPEDRDEKDWRNSQFKTINRPFDAKMKAHLLEKYGAEVFIANEYFFGTLEDEQAPASDEPTEKKVIDLKRGEIFTHDGKTYTFKRWKRGNKSMEALNEEDGRVWSMSPPHWTTVQVIGKSETQDDVDELKPGDLFALVYKDEPVIMRCEGRTATKIKAINPLTGNRVNIPQSYSMTKIENLPY